MQRRHRNNRSNSNGAVDLRLIWMKRKSFVNFPTNENTCFTVLYRFKIDFLALFKLNFHKQCDVVDRVSRKEPKKRRKRQAMKTKKIKSPTLIDSIACGHQT